MFTQSFLDIEEEDDSGSGLSELGLSGRLPFDNEQSAVLFFNHVRLKRLNLCRIELESEDACRALASVNVECLVFEASGKRQCRFFDGGVSLIESVLEGRCPRGLILDIYLFDSHERRMSFLSALRENSIIDRLELRGLVAGSEDDQKNEILGALTAALGENRNLTHFGLCQCRITDDFWRKITGAISVHPSLCSLEFTELHDEVEIQRQLTERLAGVVLANQRIDEITTDDHDQTFFLETFDRDLFSLLVAPILECNRYRKRIAPLPRITEPSIRAGILTRELAQVSTDVLCDYLLDNGHTQRQRGYDRGTTKRQRVEASVDAIIKKKDTELAKAKEELAESNTANACLSARLSCLETNLMECRHKLKEEQKLRRAAEMAKAEAKCNVS